MGSLPAEKPEFVLFMMNNDTFCYNFITKLRTKPELMKKFNIVDIDSVPVIPNEVDEVPCVYDGKGLYKGKQAFGWLNEKMSEFLDAACDGLMYSFLDGQEEQIFGAYSLIDQKNGSFGMGPQGTDPTRLTQVDSGNKQQLSIEHLMADRNKGIDIPGNGRPNLNNER
jgi:hypothetical protein